MGRMQGLFFSFFLGLFELFNRVSQRPVLILERTRNESLLVFQVADLVVDLAQFVAESGDFLLHGPIIATNPQTARKKMTFFGMFSRTAP